MLERYGSIARITSASDENLAAVLRQYPQAAEAISAAKRLVQAGREERLVGKQADTHDRKLIDFLIEDLQNPDEERLMVIYLNAQCLYQRAERISSGGRSQLVLRCRAIMQRALELGSTALIIAHNHPSEDCRPSDVDRTTTEHLKYVAAAMEIELVDHLIVGGGKAYSIKEGKYL